jgi:hypothetical protein
MFDNDDQHLDPFTAPLDDQTIREEDLDRLLDPWTPVPDHRTLDQTRLIALPTGTIQDLYDGTVTNPLPYIALLQATVGRYHGVAALWEEQTTSTATRLVWTALGIRTIAETHPLVWLESTPMMRFLRGWEAALDGRTKTGGGKAAPNRYDDDSIDPFDLPPGAADSGDDS